MNKIKLVIVDRHVLFREGLAEILRSEPDLNVIGGAGAISEAVSISKELCPDIILMDMELPDGTGIEAARAILADCPEIKIIFLTFHEDDAHLFAAIRSGAKGYLLKNMRSSKLIAAIRSVYRGEAALSRAMTARLMEELSRMPVHSGVDEAGLNQLTRREQDVLKELAKGATTGEISQHLGLSQNTIKHYIHAILEKLGVSDRRAAALFARQQGMA